MSLTSSELEQLQEHLKEAKKLVEKMSGEYFDKASNTTDEDKIEKWEGNSDIMDEIGEQLYESINLLEDLEE